MGARGGLALHDAFGALLGQKVQIRMRGHICFGALPGQTHNWRSWRPFGHPPRLVIYLHSSVILVCYSLPTIVYSRVYGPPGILAPSVTLVRYTRPLHFIVILQSHTRLLYSSVTLVWPSLGRYTRPLHSAATLGRYTRPLHSAVILVRYTRPLYSSVILV